MLTTYLDEQVNARAQQRRRNLGRTGESTETRRIHGLKKRSGNAKRKFVFKDEEACGLLRNMIKDRINTGCD